MRMMIFIAQTTCQTMMSPWKSRMMGTMVGQLQGIKVQDKLLHEKKSVGFSSHTNRVVQPKKMARGLKFRK